MNDLPSMAAIGPSHDYFGHDCTTTIPTDRVIYRAVTNIRGKAVRNGIANRIDVPRVTRAIKRRNNGQGLIGPPISQCKLFLISF